MQNWYDVIPIGSAVKIGDSGNIDAVITAIFIRPKGVAYEVVWWEGYHRHEDCLNELEILYTSTKRELIGFRQS